MHSSQLVLLFAIACFALCNNEAMKIVVAIGELPNLTGRNACMSESIVDYCAQWLRIMTPHDTFLAYACRLGWSGVEGVLDLTAAIRSLDESFRKSIPDNYRALMTALTDHFDFKLSVEYVYDLCPVDFHVYRKDSKDDDACPKCKQPRYQTLPCGKRRARLQVGLAVYDAYALASLGCKGMVHDARATTGRNCMYFVLAVDASRTT
jgi:hypothetical protein